VWFLCLLQIAAGLGYAMGLPARQYSNANLGGGHKRTFLGAAAVIALVLAAMSLGSGGVWPIVFTLVLVGALVGFSGGVLAWSGPAWKIATRAFIVSFWVLGLVNLVIHPVTQDFLAGLAGGRTAPTS
jgi:hypothetical protein